MSRRSVSLLTRIARRWPRATDRAAGMLVGALVSVVRVLPLRWFDRLSRAISWLAAPAARRRLHRMQRNLERAQLPLPGGSGEKGGLSKTAARRFQRSLIHHQIVCGLETLRVIFEPDLLRVEGYDELRATIDKAESEGPGPIYITAHAGNWELAAVLTAQLSKRRVLVLAKRSPHASLTRAMISLRERAGVDVLWNDRRLVLRDMLRALRGGGALGLVMDHRPEAGTGVRVEFFGLQTHFVAGPATLAIRERCSVISVFCMREGPFRYRLRINELAPTDHGETDVVALTQRMASDIEAAVRSHPEQWTWMYRRWRSSPVEPTESADPSD